MKTQKATLSYCFQICIALITKHYTKPSPLISFLFKIRLNDLYEPASLACLETNQTTIHNMRRRRVSQSSLFYVKKMFQNMKTPHHDHLEDISRMDRKFKPSFTWFCLLTSYYTILKLS